MIQPDELVAVIRLPRAEESSVAVIVGGLIPFAGAAAVIWLIWHAVRSNPENDLPPEERPGAGWVHGVPPPDHPLAEEQEGKKEGGPEGPPS